MKKDQVKSRKSLRTLLMLWFLLFSVVPLAFITGYSLVKYEQAIDKELTQRLRGNQRELEVILSEFEAGLLNKTRRHASDNLMTYYMSKNAVTQARALANQWMKTHFAQRLSLFSREGRLEVSLYRNEKNEIKRNKAYESSDVFLSEDFLAKAKKSDELTLVDFSSNKKVELIVFSKLRTAKGRLVGYIEEIIMLDDNFLSGLKNRLNLEVLFFNDDSESVVASHRDLLHYKPKFFVDRMQEQPEGIFELTIQDVPFGFMVSPLQWGDQNFYIAIGASKQAAKQVLKNVNVAFFTVVGFIMLLLITLSVIISKILLRPLSDLVDAITNMDADEGLVKVTSKSDTELGLVTQSFNDMAQRVHDAQNELKGKIKELEKANTEIKETQAKLVHTGKMASLGQLVAGVAHELNNPIGFIYSNMSHLREHSDQLIHLVDVAENSPEKLNAEKQKVEYDYIVEDLPKLIASCEDGARRTRDIVVGLRNFSRVEDSKAQEVDIREGIENTLKLLAGELKNRITVHKNLGEVPKLKCHPSQLNQVFMNILSNAAQAIEGDGEIFIETRTVKNGSIEISIRDTGKGMSPETAEKIFDPFFTTKTLGQGTGLGLSISYGIIQKHGGDIQVKSVPNQGTEFIITL